MLRHTFEYLDQMNQNVYDKQNIIKYITGNNVLDVGCGGGVMIELINKMLPNINVIGLDKQLNAFVKNDFRNKDNVNFLECDAVDMLDNIEYGEIDTFIFSSVLHEIYSYNEFSFDGVAAALSAAYQLLPEGGRIIIRDGIKSEENKDRIIQFKDERDIMILNKYCEDFEGREITYTNTETFPNSVIMKENDAMEFLYTYTWGPGSYHREINEQYGIYTINELLRFMDGIFGRDYKIISLNSYLQEGYNYYLSKKINYINPQTLRRTQLPNSNCLVVIQK